MSTLVMENFEEVHLAMDSCKRAKIELDKAATIDKEARDKLETILKELNDKYNKE